MIYPQVTDWLQIWEQRDLLKKPRRLCLEHHEVKIPTSAVRKIVLESAEKASTIPIVIQKLGISQS